MQEARVYGYISELLMDVWLYTTKESYEEIAWGQLGSKHFVKKAISFLNRKYGIGKNRHIFNYIVGENIEANSSNWNDI